MNIHKNSNKVFIIAEAGVNHNGSVDRAKAMIKVAAKAGADAVKFQTFTADTLVTKNAEKADYQKQTSEPKETQYEMLKRLELPYENLELLIKECRKHKIEFLSSPFDLTTIDLLVKLGIKKWKIPSGEITNLPYLREIASFGEEIILSTGMADLDEIESALNVFIDFKIPYHYITVLHCNTQYPTLMQDVNLMAMKTIEHAFPGVHVGYSDHTKGIEIPIAAAAMGAVVIEKHFTLDNKLDGPDHAASLEPDELTAMIKAVRNIEKALGDGVKKATQSEKKNIPIVRKSIVAEKNITKGEKFSKNNLTVKRPGTGISPMQWDDFVGKVAKKSYSKDDLI